MERAKRNKVLLGITAAILLSIVALSFRQWRQYSLANAEAARTAEILGSVDRLLLSLVDAETGQRGFLLTGENRYLEPYNQAVQVIPIELSKLDALLSSRPDEARDVPPLKSLIDQKLAELAEGESPPEDGPA